MQVGIVLHHLGASQAAFFAITEINKLVTSGLDDGILFYQDIAPYCIKPECAFMNSSEIWGFDGILIGTNLSSAMSIIKSISRSRKFFYVWDLEWLRRGKENFLYNMSIYQNPEIELIARSKEHANRIEKYCNRQVKLVMNDFNLEELKCQI